MKTQFRFIHFDEQQRNAPNDTESFYVCRNNRSSKSLGCVEFYEEWQQFVFSAEDTAAFSHECMTDIAAFLQELNAERKKVEA